MSTRSGSKRQHPSTRPHSPLVVGKVLDGVPTVAVRGNPSLLGDSVSGLVRAGTPGLSLISQGIQIIGTLPDGTRQGYVLQVIAGFDYAVKAEFTWARQLLLQTASPTGPGPATGTASPSASHNLQKTTLTADSAGAPYFAFRLMHTTDTGDQFSPMGRVSYAFTLWALQNSGSSDYKWYNFFWNETVQPGIMVYNSDWRVIQETDHVSASNHTSSLFVDHGPQIFGTSGPSTLSYTIGTQAGFLNAAITANQTQSYFLKNAEVTDITQDGFSLGWDHTFNARTSAGKLSYSITPGWTDRIRMDGHIDVQGSFSTTFARFTGSNVVQTSSVNTQLFVFGG